MAKSKMGATPDKLANKRNAGMNGNPQGVNDGQGGLLIDAYRRQSKARFRPNSDLDESAQRKLGGYMANGTIIDRAEGGTTGTSIFDPVLTELMYSWFCPPEGRILDPFAGGSVRGIVASILGRRYIGIDLRPEQVEANRRQSQVITPDNPPTWMTGDSRNMEQFEIPEIDFVFSCPPYYNLEVYSDDPLDLSALGTYDEFLRDYRLIISKAAATLKPDSFACFVVGDIRGKDGFYCNFVRDTITAFEDCGLRLYNDAVLITAVGSLPIRVRKQFESGRKLGKTHQNVLVFCNGDPRKATGKVGVVEIVGLIDAEDYGELLEDDSLT